MWNVQRLLFLFFLVLTEKWRTVEPTPSRIALSVVLNPTCVMDRAASCFPMFPRRFSLRPCLNTSISFSTTENIHTFSCCTFSLFFQLLRISTKTVFVLKQHSGRNPPAGSCDKHEFNVCNVMCVECRMVQCSVIILILFTSTVLFRHLGHVVQKNIKVVPLKC